MQIADRVPCLGADTLTCLPVSARVPTADGGMLGDVMMQMVGLEMRQAWPPTRDRVAHISRRLNLGCRDWWQLHFGGIMSCQTLCLV